MNFKNVEIELLTDDELKLFRMLEEIVNTVGSKGWARAANKDDEFTTLLNSLVVEDDTPFPERVLTAFRGNRTCTLGKDKKYKSIFEDWGFCGIASACPCAAESVREKCRLHNTPELCAPRVAKIKETMLARYGVDNPGRLPQAVASHKAFYADEDKVAEASQKNKATRKKNNPNPVRATPKPRKPRNRKIYPDVPAPDGMIRCELCFKPSERINNAHLHQHNMTINEYREMFPDAPIINERVREHIRETSTGRAQSDEQKRKASLAKLGKKRKGGGPSKLQDGALDILNDKEEFLEWVNAYPLRTIAKELGVGTTFISAKCEEYGVVKTSSSIEESIAGIIEDTGIEMIRRSRSIIGPYELDIYLPEHKLAIEVGGLYFHCDLKKDDHYHAMKREMCDEKGIRLITIFEDEVYNIHPVIESRIKNIIGVSNKLDSILLDIQEIDTDTANHFYDCYHIQGESPTDSISYGAYNEGELVAAMSFTQTADPSETELSRFCTDGDSYNGITKRLFDTYLEEYNPAKVTAYVDRRWSEGNGFVSIGFKQVETIPESYTYWLHNDLNRYDKSEVTIDLSIAPLGSDGKTDREIASDLGFHRIYDCGKIRFEWTPDQSPEA